MWVVGEHVVITFVKQKVTIATIEKFFILAFRTNISKAAAKNSFLLWSFDKQDTDTTFGKVKKNVCRWESMPEQPRIFKTLR